MDIGERIKRRREELDMTQDELARAAGYKSRSSINKIEIDGRGIPQTKLVALADALGVTPSYLMGWEEADYVVEHDDYQIMFSMIKKLNRDNRELLERFLEMLLNKQGGE